MGVRGNEGTERSGYFFVFTYHRWLILIDEYDTVFQNNWDVLRLKIKESSQDQSERPPTQTASQLFSGEILGTKDVKDVMSCQFGEIQLRKKGWLQKNAAKNTNKKRFWRIQNIVIIEKDVKTNNYQRCFWAYHRSPPICQWLFLFSRWDVDSFSETLDYSSICITLTIHVWYIYLHLVDFNGKYI